MFEGVDNSVINGLAIGLVSLLITMVIFGIIFVLTIDRLKLSRSFRNFLMNVWLLGGFAFWIYITFYLNVYKLYLP